MSTIDEKVNEIQEAASKGLIKVIIMDENTEAAATQYADQREDTVAIAQVKNENSDELKWAVLVKISESEAPA